jgi:hypothetical protein
VDALKLLAPEGFASLIEIAIFNLRSTTRTASLMTLAMLSRGPHVTGDGLLRIPESEWDARERRRAAGPLPKALRYFRAR